MCVMCVCVALVCVYECVHVCVYGGQRTVSTVFLCHSLSDILRENPEPQVLYPRVLGSQAGCPTYPALAWMLWI